MSSLLRRRVAVILAGLALLAMPALARQTSMKTEWSLAGFSRWIRVLQDSAVCDTSTTQDQLGAAHRVFADSGRVYYQPQRGDHWVTPVRLSLPRQVCSSPLVFEMDEPDREPLIAVLWRVETDSGVDVFCRMHRLKAHPMDWSTALCMTMKP